MSDVGWVDAALQSMGADRVLADLERARDLAEGLDDTENLARVSLLAAGCHYNLGKVSAAARTYQKVLVSVRQLLKTPAIEVDGMRGIKAAAHLGLGLCFTDQGQFQKAEFNYTSARVLLRELDEPRLQVQLQAQWGRLHTERGYSALAIEHLDAGLAIAMQPSMGYRMGQGECLISKAKALIDLDENQKAVELARTAARIGSDISNGALVRDGNYVEALALVCDDELERAQSVIDAACRTIRDPVQYRVFHSAFALQGVIAIRRRDYSGAAEAFGQAQTRARTPPCQHELRHSTPINH